MTMTAGYEALRRGAAMLDLSARGRITARGRDRARLLHNLSTNEVKKMTPGSGCYAFLLTPQGRIQADVYLFCFPEHFLMDTQPDLREKVPQLIRKYIIADQVELEDVTDATAAIALEGPTAAAVLASLGVATPGVDYAHVPWNDCTVAAITLTGQPGFRIYGAAAQREELMHKLEAAGAVLATDDDARMVRIENGRPQHGVDIRETSLVQETQQMHAVSFNKGCYIGQEIVERVRAQGHINKKLVRVAIDTAAPVEPGTKLSAGGAEVGEVTSSVASPEFGKVVALAIVRTAQAEPGTELTTATGEKASVVKV